jgi:hypothetical protein
MAAIPEYEIYAMKYAERQADLSTFMLGVEPGRETITIDYVVWLLQGAEPIVVDTGFTPMDRISGFLVMTRQCCSDSRRRARISLI